MTKTKITFLLLFNFSLLHAVYAQSDKAEYLKLIGDKDPAFDIHAAPKAMDKESAVILAEKQTYTSTRVISNDLTWRYQKRRKILLLDKAAVEEFSYFYFQGETNKRTSYPNSHEEFDSLQILITKPNGTSKLVDLTKAVKVEKDISIPSIFRGSASEYYQKVAIPDLEPGDIIDYCILEKYLIWIALIPTKFEFPPILYTLDNTYPTVKHKFSIEIPNNIKAMGTGYLALYLNTYNGAPAIKKEVKENTTSFLVEANDLPKDEYERWSYPLRTSPTVKGKVIYIRERPGKDKEIIKKMIPPIPFDIKQTVSADEIKAWAIQTSQYNTDYYAATYGSYALGYLKKYHSKETDPVAIAKAAYYRIRTGTLYEGWSTNWRTNNVNFLSAMKIVFDAKKIKYSIIAVVPRKISSLDDVLLTDEIDILFKLDGPKPVYIYNVYRHAAFGEILHGHEGNDAYEITNFDNKKIPASIKKIKIPMTSASENVSVHTFAYTIDEEFEKINVDCEETIKGIAKDDYYNDLLIFSEYEDYDIKRFEDPNRVTYAEKLANKKIKEPLAKKNAAEYKEETDARKEGRKKSIEGDFQVESYDDFTLVQDGRTEDKIDIVFKEKYKITGLLKKAGNNYLFEAGKLIGGQVEIKEKEMDRKVDIYMDNARSFVYNITVNLPEGYTVKDAAKLNINVTNETGSFKAVTKVTDNVMTIEISKVYNHNFEKKENWPKMVAFLDACYDFTQTKVLIVKK
ncbi:MAG: hypothetical protein H7282_04760 [Cytophagaceae bacterium]|nr:hypothetical protein [Cytophagaceae bacterium]